MPTQQIDGFSDGSGVVTTQALDDSEAIESYQTVQRRQAVAVTLCDRRSMLHQARRNSDCMPTAVHHKHNNSGRSMLHQARCNRDCMPTATTGSQ